MQFLSSEKHLESQCTNISLRLRLLIGLNVIGMILTNISPPLSDQLKFVH